MIFFGVTTTPAALFMALLLSAFMIFSPFVILSVLTESLAEPMKTITFVLFALILFPALVSYYYRKKMLSKGTPSLIFWIYCSWYFFLFLISCLQFFVKDLSMESVAGVVISGCVSGLMIASALKTKRLLRNKIQETYEWERDENVQRMAEAIVLAEEMKSQIKKS